MESLLLKDEKVENVYEYEPDKLVISLYPDGILITDKWRQVNVIKNNRPGNINNHWVLPFPFNNSDDGEKLPFLVMSGRESFSLINLRDFTRQKLIASACVNLRCQ